MTHEVTPGWRVADIGGEVVGIKIDGLDVWKEPWKSLGYCVWLPHPQWPLQIHNYEVYEAGVGPSTVLFAAAELSNGCWGFYVPDQS